LKDTVHDEKSERERRISEAEEQGNKDIE